MATFVRRLALVFLAVLFLIHPQNGAARMHPTFTPADLVTQSETILQVELTGGSGDLQLKLVRAIKGVASQDWQTTNSLKPSAGAADLLDKVSPPPRRPALALWFMGSYTRAFTAQKPASTLLHLNGQWFRVTRSQGEAVWVVEGQDSELQTVWNGGTDMLLRAVDYILKETQTGFPVRANSTWRPPEKLGRVPGKLHGLIAVDLYRNGSLSLFVPSDEGDCLFRRESGQEELKPVWLGSRSQAAVWGEFNGDQRLDFVSAHGTSLTLWVQTSSGEFVSTNIPLSLSNRAVGLNFWGWKEQSGVLVSSERTPWLLTREARGTLTARSAGEIAPDAATNAGAFPALGRVADFDGDAWPDLVQLCEGVGLFYKGNAAGTLDSPRPLAGLRNISRARDGIVGDFDADGLPDLFWISAGGGAFWQNRGEGRFEDVLTQSGELADTMATNAISGVTGDFNNDGWHDLVLFRENGPPQFFFNRGFRSFGWAGEYETTAMMGEAVAGQKAGILIDLDEDGAQDLLVVSTSGEVWLIRQSVDETARLGLRAVLARDGFPGPVTVRAFRGPRPFSASSAVTGGAGAFFGLSEPGRLTLRWQFPQAAPQEQEFIAEEGELRVWLSRDGARSW